MGFKIPKIKNPISTIASGGLNLPEVKKFGQGNLGFVTSLGQGDFGGAMDNFKSSFGIGGDGPKPPGAGEDPTVSALRNRLYGEAQQFEQGLGGMQKSASDQIQREGDLAQKEGLQGTRRGYNRRGLLYSGLREGGEQSVRGRVASTMSQQKAQSNKELTDMAKAKWTTAAQAGLQGYQDAVNREAEIEGINLQNQVARAQSMQQLGQIGGQAAGSYYANRNTAAPAPAQQGGYQPASYTNSNWMTA